MRSLVSTTISLLLAACGAPPPAAPPPAAATSASAAPHASAAAPPAPPASSAPARVEGLPADCDPDAKRAGSCVPSPAHVDLLCRAASADAALVMFAKGSPWTRAFLTRDTEAWNAAGGTTSKGKLAFDEEVIVLRKRDGSSMIVGQGASFDVLRWDGSCASLAQEELTEKRPPKAKAGPVSWRDLGQKTRDALLADPKLSAAFEKRRKECKGVTTGDVSAACVKADAALAAGIVDAVRGGLAAPAPELR